MPSTIFRRLDLPADPHDIGDRHDEYLSKIEAVVEMESTDSSTAEVASSEHGVAGVDRREENVSRTLGLEIPMLVSEEGHESAASALSLPYVEIEEDEAANANSGSAKIAVARTAPSTPITPETYENGEAEATARSIAAQRVKDDVLAALQQPTLEEERPKEKKGSSKKTTTHAKNDDLLKHRFGSGGNITFLRPRRGRVVSLDRGRGTDPFFPSFDDAGYQTQESVSAHTDGDVGRRHSASNSDRHNHSHTGGRRSKSLNGQSHYYNDDESSSDDDSSYFATHLPSPKSGGSFSLSSAASAPARTGAFQLLKQESDASLSFSDESDEEGRGSHHEQQRNHPTNAAEQPNQRSVPPSAARVHLAPIVNPNRSVVDMHLYPQRITRMHSVSSLVSSASSNDDSSSSSSSSHGEEGSRGSRPRSSTAESLTSTSTSDGPELSTLDAALGGEFRPSSQGTEISGRRSPVMGHHASRDSDTPSSPGGSFYLASSSMSGHPQHQHHPEISHQHSRERSPLPIQQGYLSPAGMLVHPQPMTSQQMMVWAGPTPLRDTVVPGVGTYAGFAPAGMASQQLLGVVGPSAPPEGSCNLHPGGFRNNSEHTFSSTSGSIAFNYSEDEDVFEGYHSSIPHAAVAGYLSSMGAAGGIPAFNQRLAGSGGGGSSTFMGQVPIPGSSGELGLGRQNEPGQPGSDGGANGATTRMNDEEVAEATDAAMEASGGDDPAESTNARQPFKVYWRRWIMLMYMSILNLLSDWTCYSVAPISLLTEEAFGRIDPERLVVIFLVANAVSTACEPIILARLGLRRTVLFGALLLMIGSIVKSGGLPPIIEPNLEFGHAQWSLYIGFFLVGLSQPLYQCTPALLSASWFPEKERTMATGVALNANQVGIGFAFIFGTLLVAKADDIPRYFGLLSQISTVVFIGTLIQFADAPPTPPSSSARAMRGDLNFNIPRISRFRSMVQNVGNKLSNSTRAQQSAKAEAPSPAGNLETKKSDAQRRESSGTRKSGRASLGRRGSSTRRRATAPRSQSTNTQNGLAAPSSAIYGSTSDALTHISRVKAEAASLGVLAQAPSPAMSGRVSNPESDTGSTARGEEGMPAEQGIDEPMERPMTPGHPSLLPTGMMPSFPYGYGYPPPHQYPYYDPRILQQIHQQMQQQQALYQQQYYQQQQPLLGPIPPLQMPYYPPPQTGIPPSYQHFPGGLQEFEPLYDMYGADPYEEGAEPIVTITPHNCDIDIRDDQVIRSLHACMIRPGFSHAVAAFTVSGIVINTLSTYMDYLVRLNGAPRSYTGIVGGTFQFVIMISSLIVGKQTDKTRAYYSVTIAMLVFGAFGLAECGVSLDSNSGGDLRWTLIVVAALVGPLQPVSTELGVEVAYPLSENTVLVIQQLFSNLLSAIFIPFFKALKNVGSTQIQDGEVVERPDFTFSFYLLIVLHTGVTVYFATFNGKYLRYEHELQKKADEDREDAEMDGQTNAAAFHPFYASQAPFRHDGVLNPELQPLMQNPIV